MSVLACLRSFCVFSIVAVVWGIKYHEPHVDILAANQYWRAVNCDSLGVQDPQVFASVRHAIKTEHREVYLAINTAWMDRFLNPGQRVVVTCVRASELAWSHLEQYAHNDDELHALYTLGRVDQPPNPPSASATASAYQEPDADAGRRAALDLRLSALLPAVDRFLLHNPCWLVLRDGLSSHFPSSSTSSSYNASTNTRLRHRGSTSPHGTDSSNSLSADPSFVSASIFLRLPSNPLGVTCRLFEAVTRRQFPATCPTDSHEMFFYAMQNFGFGGEANKVSANLQVLSLLVHLNHYNGCLLYKKSSHFSSFFLLRTCPWMCIS